MARAITRFTFSGAEAGATALPLTSLAFLNLMQRPSVRFRPPVASWAHSTVRFFDASAVGAPAVRTIRPSVVAMRPAATAGIRKREGAVSAGVKIVFLLLTAYGVS